MYEGDAVFLGVILAQQLRHSPRVGRVEKQAATVEFHAVTSIENYRSRLAWLPTVRISLVNMFCGIARLAGPEFTVCRHPRCSELTSVVAVEVEFERYPAWRGEEDRGRLRER